MNNRTENNSITNGYTSIYAQLAVLHGLNTNAIDELEPRQRDFCWLVLRAEQEYLWCVLSIAHAVSMTTPVIETISNEFMNLLYAFWTSARNEGASANNQAEETETLRSRQDEEARNAGPRFYDSISSSQNPSNTFAATPSLM